MVKRIGVEDNGLTFEQAAKILKTVDEAIGDDFALILDRKFKSHYRRQIHIYS